MNNPEKLATFGTQDTWRTQKKTQHRKKDEHNKRHQIITLNTDARGKLAVPTSYTVTNIERSGKILFGDRGKKKIYVEGKQFIAIWDMDIT